jgi:hypothetical protein
MSDLTDDESAEIRDAMARYAASDAFGCMTAVEGKAFRAGWLAGRDWQRAQEAAAPIEHDLEEIPDHGQYDHVRDVVRRYAITNPIATEN